MNDDDDRKVLYLSNGEFFFSTKENPGNANFNFFNDRLDAVIIEILLFVIGSWKLLH